MNKCIKCSSSTYEDYSNERHYAALRCSNCHKFIKCLPKPKNIIKNSQRNDLIQKLLKSTIITNWEKEFLENIKDNKKLSPKQQDCLNDISLKLGGV